MTATTQHPGGVVATNTDRVMTANPDRVMTANPDGTVTAAAAAGIVVMAGVVEASAVAVSVTGTTELAVEAAGILACIG